MFRHACGDGVSGVADGHAPRQQPLRLDAAEGCTHDHDELQRPSAVELRHRRKCRRPTSDDRLHAGHRTLDAGIDLQVACARQAREVVHREEALVNRRRLHEPDEGPRGCRQPGDAVPWGCFRGWTPPFRNDPRVARGAFENGLHETHEIDRVSEIGCRTRRLAADGGQERLVLVKESVVDPGRRRLRDCRGRPPLDRGSLLAPFGRVGELERRVVSRSRPFEAFEPPSGREIEPQQRRSVVATEMDGPRVVRSLTNAPAYDAYGARESERGDREIQGVRAVGRDPVRGRVAGRRSQRRSHKPAGERMRHAEREGARHCGAVQRGVSPIEPDHADAVGARRCGGGHPLGIREIAAWRFFAEHVQPAFDRGRGDSRVRTRRQADGDRRRSGACHHLRPSLERGDVQRLCGARRALEVPVAHADQFDGALVLQRGESGEMDGRRDLAAADERVSKRWRQGALLRPRCGAGRALRGSFSSRIAALYAKTAITVAC